MNDGNEEKLRQLVRKAMGPGAAELKRDLWPQMLRKLDERPIRVSGLDWALVALLVVWLLVFPEAIPQLLYHL